MNTRSDYRILYHSFEAPLPRGRARREQIAQAEHALLQEALQGAVPPVAHTAYGKPFFPSLPSFHFNFSDSGTWLVLAWSSNEIGIDLQQITGTRYDPLAIARRFYTKEENDLLQRQQAADPLLARRTFFRLWSIKEAYLKFLGIGLAGGMNRYRIEPLTEQRRTEQRSADAAPSGGVSGNDRTGPDHYLTLTSGRILSRDPSGESTYLSAGYLELEPPEKGYALAIVQNIALSL